MLVMTVDISQSGKRTDLLHVSVVAEVLGISMSQALFLASSGDLKLVKVGRRNYISSASLDAFRERIS